MALESMAIDGAKSLLQMAAARGLDEFNLLWGFKDDVRNFQKDFRMIEALLSGVDENSRDMLPAAREWLKKVKNLAYDAQDLMDELSYENIRLQVELKHQFKNKFRNLFTSSNPIVFRIKMAHKVTDLKASIAEIYKLAKNLKSSMELIITPSETIADQYRNRTKVLQQARDMANVSVMFGREADKSKLLEELHNCTHTGKDARHIVSIVGLPGIGKTTLARQVYDDEALKDVFATKFWVTVSRDFDIGRILQDMFEGAKDNVHSSPDAIRKELQEQLRGKKYLLVLDDVWNTETILWDNFMSILQDIGEAIVLVTTRDHQVANVMSATLVHDLTKLDEGDSWCLFEQVAFDGRSKDETWKFERTGKEIVKKCDGLPLAIKSIAGMLRPEDELRQWKNIEKSELWSLPLGDAGILPSLKLSFNYLPSSTLKRCFAFLSTFVKGEKIYKVDIIPEWMALGYLTEGKKTISNFAEDIGETYLKALLNISFLLTHEVDELGNITVFRMHDLVHDLASYVNDECIHWKDTTKVEEDSTVRMLMLYKSYEELANIQETIELRSLRLFDSRFRIPNELLVLARFLRVLDISWSGIKELPTAVGGLKCLQLLDLCGNPIEDLTESITKLYNLQTLKIPFCKRLSQLPVGLGKLTSLRHILTSTYVKVPPGIARLTSLQTAPLLELGPTNDGTFQMHELGSLPHISGVLSIRGLQHVKIIEQAKEAKISKKDRLEALDLTWSGEREDSSSISDYDVLDALQPHEDLKSLKLQGFNSEELPAWLQRMAILDARTNEYEPFDNLVKLELIECKRCRELPALGQLKSLRILRLQKMSSVERISSGQSYDGEDSHCNTANTKVEGNCFTTNRNEYFAALKELIIEDFPNLKEWLLPRADGRVIAFASLEVLKIIGCPKLAVVPEVNFSSLSVLVVEEVSSDEPLQILFRNCSFQSLTSLTIKNIKGLIYLPKELSLCKSLRELRLIRCWNLSDLVDENGRNGLNQLLSLQVLEVDGCTWLAEQVKFPDISQLVSLRELLIGNCKRITRPPSGLENCTSLSTLKICWCENMQIPDNFLPQLHCVQVLFLIGLGEGMARLFEGIQRVRGLISLGVGGFGEEYDYFPGLSHLCNIPSLEKLNLYGWDRLQSLPKQLLQFKALKMLTVVGFQSMEVVPEWLADLLSLEVLRIFKCHKLKSLPSGDALKCLSKLWFFELSDCLLLKERCAKNIGPEWHKIAHIRQIKIDGEFVHFLDSSYGYVGLGD